MLQLVAQQERKDTLDVPDYFVPLVSKLDIKRMGGAVLFGPYVDYKQLYEHERKGSFLRYAQHDLIVNEVGKLVMLYCLEVIHLKAFLNCLSLSHAPFYSMHCYH